MTLPRMLVFALCSAFATGLSLAQTEVSQSTPASTSQTPEPEKKPADPAAPPNQFAIGPVQFSALVDGYYSLNFNHPASGNNQLRNFDLKANQFSLNMAKITMEHSADPVGFRMDLGFGRAFDLIHSSETAPDAVRYVEQAYVTFKPAKLKGIQLDFGKFVTSAGAEVIETNSNWNYSRSILFSWAIPYYHFGLRTTIPVGKYFSTGVQVINGWNNVEDNNSGKTFGMVGAFTTSKFSWSNNYYVGPEKASTNKGYRQLYDTTLLLTPNPKANFYLNFDYGHEKTLTAGNARWVGVAGAARFQLTPILALAPRLEWYNDATGFTTGTAQKLKEFTMTAETKVNDYALARFEYRRDWSDQRFFDRGNTPAAYKNQDTLLVGIVAFFGPKK